MFSSVASPLSFWRTGLIEFVGEIESGGWPFPWPFVGVEAWGMLHGTNECQKRGRSGTRQDGKGDALLGIGNSCAYGALVRLSSL